VLLALRAGIRDAATGSSGRRCGSPLPSRRYRRGRACSKLQQARQCECRDSHHHISNGDVYESACQKTHGDKEQPGASGIGAQDGRGARYGNLHSVMIHGLPLFLLKRVVAGER
jgi:hypothetical protein